MCAFGNMLPQLGTTSHDDLRLFAGYEFNIAGFSSVCWYFIKQMHDLHNGTLNVAGIHAAVPSTFIKRWSSPDGVDACYPDPS